MSNHVCGEMYFVTGAFMMAKDKDCGRPATKMYRNRLGNFWLCDECYAEIAKIVEGDPEGAAYWGHEI